MDISRLNYILSEVKSRLDSLNPDNLQEAQKRPEEHDSKRMSQAQRRLQNLYGKLTKGRSDTTKVQAYGSKRK